MSVLEASFVVLRHKDAQLVLPVLLDAVHASTVLRLIWPRLRSIDVTKLLRRRHDAEKLDVDAWLRKLEAPSTVIGYDCFYCRTIHLRCLLDFVRAKLARVHDRIAGVPTSNPRSSVLYRFFDEEVWGDIHRAPFSVVFKHQQCDETPVSSPTRCPTTPNLKFAPAFKKRRCNEFDAVLPSWEDIESLFD